MLIIPVQPIPNQNIQVNLGGQQCSLSIAQTNYGLFMDVASNGAPIVYGVLCHDVDRIVRDAYLGFTGDLVWYDTSGAGEDPVYTGLGSQFELIYLEAADLAGA